MALPEASSSAKSAAADPSAAAPSPLAVDLPNALAFGPSSPVAVVSAMALPVPSTDVEEVVLPELASPSKAASAEVAAAAPSPIVKDSPNVKANWSSTEPSAVLTIPSALLLASPVPSTDVEDMAVPEASSSAKSAAADPSAAAPSPLAVESPLALAIGPSSPV